MTMMMILIIFYIWWWSEFQIIRNISMYFLEILSMNTKIILNFSGATPFPLNFIRKPLHIVIFVKKNHFWSENTMLTDSSVQRCCQSLFLVEVVSLVQTGTKIRKHFQKLSFQSFWWGAWVLKMCQSRFSKKKHFFGDILFSASWFGASSISHKPKHCITTKRKA